MGTLLLKVVFQVVFQKIIVQVSFWRTLTHTDIIEFQNFFLQLNNQRSGSKSVSGFSIILILKGIMTL